MGGGRAAQHNTNREGGNGVCARLGYMKLPGDLLVMLLVVVVVGQRRHRHAPTCLPASLFLSLLRIYSDKYKTSDASHVLIRYLFIE